MLKACFQINFHRSSPDFSDALADPRAYLSKQEKHAQQLKKLGIDEQEMNSQEIIESQKKKALNGTMSTNGGSGGAGMAANSAGSSSPAKSHIAGLMSRKSTKDFEELEEVSDKITKMNKMTIVVMMLYQMQKNLR